MSRRLGLAALFLFALIGAAYGLTLPAVGGEGLALITHLRPDDHLLTAWLVPLLSRALGAHLVYLRIVNVLVFSLVAFLAVGGRAKRAVWAALFILLATSPLIVSVLLNPLGFEDLISFALVLLAAADIAGIRVLGHAARFLVALALALQDPWLSPAAALYGILATPPIVRSFAPLAGVGLAIAFRIYVVPVTAPAWPPVADSTAGPVTAVAAGAFLFGIVPLFLIGLRQRVPTVVALAGAPLLRCALLGVAIACAGSLSQSGDPSAYWLDAEACFLIGGIASALRRGPAVRRDIVTAGAAVLALQLLVFAYFLPAIPGLEISRATSVVEQALGSVSAAASPACIVSDQAGRRHVLADGALLLLRHAPASTVVENADTCATLRTASDLTMLTDMSATDWGRGGVALLRATLAASGPGVLPIAKGIVSPRARASTPTGEGAFGNIIEAPGGTVGQFTVLTGFSYLFPCAPAGHQLTFAVAPADAHGAYAYRVSLIAFRHARTLASAVVASTPRTDSVQPWQWRSVTLPEGKGCRAILFSAPVEPSVAGAWVMFAGATVH